MPLPFIDVVVPTFNRAAMLERLLSSLLEQNYPAERYRVIVVDDGSTDATWPLLQKISAGQSLVRALRAEHGGAYAARNRGWQSGRGEIVAFTDDDCVAAPGWLAAIAKGFADHPQALGLQGKTVTIPELVTPLTHQIVVGRPTSRYETCNIAYRRDALVSVGGFDDEAWHSGDSQIGAAVSALGPVIFHPEMIVIHPPRPRIFFDREQWRRQLEGLLRLYSRQPDFFRRHWGRWFPLAVGFRWGVGSTIKRAAMLLPWLARDPVMYFTFLRRLLRERAVLLAMLPEFWREAKARIKKIAAASPAGRAVRLLGVAVHPLTWERLREIIADAVENDRGSIIAHHNLHSIYYYHHDPAVRSFYSRAQWIHIDGMSLVLLGRLLGLPLGRSQRLTHLDWIRPLLAEAVRREWRIFYLGSRPGVAERGAGILRGEFPGLRLETMHGYFDARPEGAENRRVIEAVERTRPHLLLVGMGVPRQERWILENRERLRAGAIFNTGALMDYIAGEATTPPRWMGRVGLEWLFRLATDPARLWKRYLIEPWFVAGLFLAERFGRQTHAT
jgi:N-acetylglucosaminyldiphosphoundecaprenol N-acetyl-beta-D-mannosaminyltransferase